MLVKFEHVISIQQFTAHRLLLDELLRNGFGLVRSILNLFSVIQFHVNLESRLFYELQKSLDHFGQKVECTHHSSQTRKWYGFWRTLASFFGPLILFGFEFRNGTTLPSHDDEFGTE